ncbi:MAG TPA: polysaccharide deacetylase family protein [Casimicrobiaceae bacterium]|nr:polysaccharide deacetylase family protein [Casimicrobiaceae bacterium]
MRIPVLAYHAVNIAGNDYATNDHVAFAADLRLIHALGLRIVPLAWVVDALAGVRERDLAGCVAMSCDDGSDFDWFDLDHPEHGPQRSLYGCMNDFAAEFGAAAQPDLHLTAFVIASAEARGYLDRNCLAGRGWMSDRWWRPALDSGRMAIENHSYDHNHAAIPLPGIGGMERGSFFGVDTRERADAEIADAARLIDAAIAPRRTTLFCYPYSHVNDYLRREYFPQCAHVHGMRAAFGDGAEPVTAASDRWNLPRYICGYHWKSPDELEKILRETA